MHPHPVDRLAHRSVAPAWDELALVDVTGLADTPERFLMMESLRARWRDQVGTHALLTAFAAAVAALDGARLGASPEQHTAPSFADIDQPVRDAWKIWSRARMRTASSDEARTQVLAADLPIDGDHLHALSASWEELIDDLVTRNHGDERWVIVFDPHERLRPSPERSEHTTGLWGMLLAWNGATTIGTDDRISIARTSPLLSRWASLVALSEPHPVSILPIPTDDDSEALLGQVAQRCQDPEIRGRLRHDHDLRRAQVAASPVNLTVFGT